MAICFETASDIWVSEGETYNLLLSVNEGYIIFQR